MSVKIKQSNAWSDISTSSNNAVDSVADGNMNPVTSNAVYDTLNTGIRPRSTGRIVLAQEVGDLATSEASATEYTASDNGMVIAHISKTDYGNTCYLYVNGVMVDVYDFFSPTISATAGISEITLTAFVRTGDKIKVFCNGNGDRYNLANLIIQPISWYA